ncbi:hypothetical protein [Pedobacter nutrimenti]|uniref:hypothetical protein n=1 Tax=Pedobacter nutrimenti TaxID=1241337 RepID=UPI0029309339|nr:hypothetical protein [Pedobacter nutrimenti]
MKRILLSLAFLSLTSLGFAQKTKNFKIMPSQAKEAKDKGNVKLADSIAQDYINNYLFKLKEGELMTKDNLSFIREFINIDGKGFKLFIKQPDKVNVVLGDYAAQYGIRMAIYKACMPKGDINIRKNVDWNSLEKTITSKYGAVGQEEVYANAMYTYQQAEDWINFGKYYMLYFKKALKHPVYEINNLSWSLFEHVEDQDVLRFACDVMKYAIEEFAYKDYQSLDTYANLLYKTGKKDEAITWEEKAVKLSNNEKSIVETLDKMKNNIATWPQTAKN